MSELEKHPGEDGVDFNDHNSVKSWIDKKLAENEEILKKDKISMAVGDAVASGEIDLAGLSGDLRKELENVVTEFDQRLAEFQKKLDSADTAGAKSGHGVDKWERM